MGNFKFLEEKWPMLYNLGEAAERNVYIDSNTTLMKVGMFGEIVVKYMLSMEGIDENILGKDNNHNNRIKLLKKEELINPEIDNILYLLRIKRNKASHDIYENIEDAKIELDLVYKLGVWFMQTYGDWDFEPEGFVLPKEGGRTKDSKELIEQFKKREKELESELNSLRESQKTKSEQELKIETKERKDRGKIASSKIELSEAETRNIIDAQLRGVGWEADTKLLRYSKGTRPQKNKNIAIAEWPTYSEEKGNGAADYALFIGLKLVGIIEAKKYSKDVLGNMVEAKLYAEGIREEDAEYKISNWGNYGVPFLFVSNGRKYIKEIENKSGVHFLDCRDNENHPKPLQGWYSPEKLSSLLEQDINRENKSLDELDFDFLQDENGVGLRYYQVEAIKAVEATIKRGDKSALVAMATGTGKTRTVLGLIYRLLKTKRFKRILFLVDRTELGTQALDTFTEVKIEDLKTLNEIYNINGLEDKNIEKETKIHIATVQALVKRLLYSDDEKNKPGVGDYDCIVIDEAHRGYTLDTEMSDDEVEWKDDKEFISKYKRVVEYFDAFKVALTATPAIHTSMIFNKPVYNYTYREAVIDGYLIDHDPPTIIETELSKKGIHYKKGDKVAKYDKITGELINGEELEDDLDFDVESFNKRIIVKSHTVAALRDIALDISQVGSEGKTLIFAVNDTHADMIVTELKNIYDDLIGGIDDNAILKITGKIKDQELAIKRFKNEKYPNIAVTVDLLSTGIDVPEIDKIVFLRKVKSRILYEQMIGRATRLCPKIEKTHFEIFDCVGVYKDLQDVTNMKPVVSKPDITFEILKQELERESNTKKQAETIKKVIAKLQRKKITLKGDSKTLFKAKCNNMTPEEFIQKLKSVDTNKAIDLIIKNNQLIEFLDEKSEGNGNSKIIISDAKDKVTSHKRGYGKGTQPGDYLEEFKNYIEENKNTLLGLELVCNRPQALTRETLKQLKVILDKSGFNEEYLKTAWKDLKNEDIAADIIAFIRQQALGSVLISNEERVKKAVARIKMENYFNTIQLKFLEKIEKVMIKESIIDEEAFSKGKLKTDGGYNRFNKIFDENLDGIIVKLNTYMFEDKNIS